jgi:large subunit ribosomal protein L6
MSRVGKQPLAIPPGVTVELENRTVTVTGPRGRLEQELPDAITMVQTGEELRFERASDLPTDRSRHGLSRTLVANLIAGVTEGFETVLEMVGVGYRAEVKGGHLLLNIGFSHPVLMKAPEGIQFAVNADGSISVKGINKYLVGQVAANIRALRPPEPYKGKGVRYRGEHVRRKAGKTGAGA